MVGQTAQLNAEVLPAETTDKTVTWTSSATSVARVSADGTVTATGLGHVVITATCGDVKAACEVNVVPTPAESLTLSAESMELRVGATAKLSATVLPADATDKTVTWATSDAAVARVSADGTVTAVGIGRTSISAACGDVRAVCEVRVVAIGTCAAPAIDYDGQMISITADSNDEVRYTVDGSQPTAESPLYNGPFNAGGIITLKAQAYRQNYDPSEVTVYSTPAYFNGNDEVWVAVPDSMTVALKAADITAITDLHVIGSLGSEDFACIRGMRHLMHLDLSETNVENLPEQALAQCGIVTVSMPREIKSLGHGIFSGCDALSAIIWYSETPLYNYVLDGEDNPNLLIYVNSAAQAPQGRNNVIVDYRAESIVLTDTDRYPFYCPVPFFANKISYTHKYTQRTPLGGCSGWETLALPFTPTWITHIDKGEIKPFAALGSDYGEYKPFWLYEMDGSGRFVPAATIQAFTPYLISMPNNDEYSPEYVLGGEVTFSSVYVEVQCTEINRVCNGSMEFVHVFGLVPRSVDILSLNVDSPFIGYQEGSVFVRGFGDVHAFQAYITDSDKANTQLRVSSMIDDHLSALRAEIINGTSLDLRTVGGVLYITADLNQSLSIYSLSGALIRVIDLQPGITTVTDLPDGVYFANSKKLIIKR